MPIVTIQESSGRTNDQRKQLLREITQAFVSSYGIESEAVTVFFNSVDDSHWGKAGRLALDINRQKE